MNCSIVSNWIKNQLSSGGVSLLLMLGKEELIAMLMSCLPRHLCNVWKALFPEHGKDI